MPDRLPSFRSEAEEAQFWDQHDSTELLSELTEEEDTVFVGPECGLIEVRPAMWRRLLQEAKRRRTTPQRLVQRWIQEQLKRQTG